jgi:hypothetical protein
VFEWKTRVVLFKFWKWELHGKGDPCVGVIKGFLVWVDGPLRSDDEDFSTILTKEACL